MKDELKIVVAHIRELTAAAGFESLNVDETLVQLGIDSLQVSSAGENAAASIDGARLQLASLELTLREALNAPALALSLHTTPAEIANRPAAAAKNSTTNVKRRFCGPHRRRFSRTARRLLDLRVTHALSEAQKHLVAAAAIPASDDEMLECIEFCVPRHIDEAHFARVWHLVSVKHAALRTHLTLDGQKVQSTPVCVGEQNAHLCVQIELRPLGTQTRILFRFHHALLDAHSLERLWSDVWRAYDDLAASQRRRSPKRQYVEWCEREAHHINAQRKSEKWRRDVEFWRRQLADYDDDHGTFQGVADVAPMRSAKFTQIDCKLDVALSARLRAYARAAGVTLFAALSALIRLLLYKLYAVDDLVAAFPLRQQNIVDDDGDEFATTIGAFFNVSMCRVLVNARRTLDNFARTTHEAIREALEHAKMPFNQLLAELRAASTDTTAATTAAATAANLFSVVFVDDQTATTTTAADEPIANVEHLTSGIKNSQVRGMLICTIVQNVGFRFGILDTQSRKMSRRQLS